MIRNTLLLLIMAVILCGQVVFAQADDSKLSMRAEQALSRDGTSLLWLFFDSTRVSSTPVALTEKALARRAKVDPSGYLITANDYPLDASVIADIEAAGLTVRHVSRWFRAVSVEADLPQAQSVQSIPGLERVDLVGEYEASVETEQDIRELPEQSQGTLDIDYGSSLTQNQFAGAVRLHDFGLSGNGVLIAMFDSGFEPDHPALDSTSIVATWDFIHGIADVSGRDCENLSESQHQDRHGTFSLGVAGAYLPGTLIGTGYGADFALAKTEITCAGTEIKIEEDNWIAAAEWADSLGADIISASLGYYWFQDSGSYTQSQLDGNTARITIAADLAASKNILVVTAAGNERGDPWGTIIFPSDGDSVLAVGATNSSGSLASFSSPGPSADGRTKPDIVSQGVSVYSARALNSGYSFVSGTSFSTPLVAGAASLALEHDPTLTAMELLELIKSTGSMADSPDNDFGYGRFDAVLAADILNVDPVEPLEVELGDSAIFPVSVSGRTTISPDLSLLDAPSGVSLLEIGSGMGEIQVTGMAENLGAREFFLVADIGEFADTARVVLNTYMTFEGVVRAGPNPFSDSVNIFIDTSATSSNGRFVVSIYNSAGEKVWELFNNSSFSADVITWDGHNSSGEPVTSGVYLVYVETDRVTRHLKLLKLD